MDTSKAQTSWHNLTIQETVSKLNTTPAGLSPVDAAARLKTHGPNELQAGKRTSPWMMFAEQFKNVLVIILLFATVLSGFLGHGLEAGVIAVIVIFSVTLGFIQEYRAERALEALRDMAALTATVVRDGVESEIPVRELVPGDLVILTAGDKIPADLRLTEAINLQIEEAMLTGESVPVEKQCAAIDKSEVPLAEKKNCAFSGTIVTYGRGRGIVYATGMKTEFGKIATMLESIESTRTPLQENLDRVGHVLARIAFVIVTIIMIIGLMRGQPFVEILIFSIALAVAVVPEALPAVVTISLAIGVQKMVRRHALVRKLQAVETLGCTSVICSDKTGTLTKDEMTVRQCVVADRIISVTGTGYDPQGSFCDSQGNTISAFPDLVALLQAAVLCNDAVLIDNPPAESEPIKGDPTEAALLVVGKKANLHKTELESRFPRVHEIPFASETKRMTTMHQSGEKTVSFTKGAPEMILPLCTRQRQNDQVIAIGEAERQGILDQAQVMAKQSLRVLAIAEKTDTDNIHSVDDLTFLGLIGMMDPPRPEAREAIATCVEAGVNVVMITGDHPLTAQAVGKELGLLKHGRVVTGVELEKMSEDELSNQIHSIDIFARVSPAHKLRLVESFQRQGQIVAMTGDGVNDAPALKKADIGVAMGITGTDVTKEAAAMTLTDDNFASIVAAVEEGRGIFSNIKKYLMYLLSSNLGEIGLMAGATLLGLPMPLSAVQILYVNLATDGLPALALAVDPPEKDLMSRPPRNPRTGIFTRPVVTLMTIGGVWSALTNLGVFVWMLQTGRSLTEAMTMTFMCLVLIQFFKAYNFRSDRLSVLNQPFANKWLNIAIVWELILLAFIIYVPFLEKAFGTCPLSLNDWIILIVLSFSVMPVLELGKWGIRRGWFGAE